MLSYKRISIFFLAIIAILTAALMALQNGGQRAKAGQYKSKSQAMVERENKYPVAEYEEPEPADLNEREKKRAKGKKYEKDKSELSVDPHSELVTTSGHWASSLSAIPSDESTAIVVGRVTEAKAHLSPNRHKVYSEFTVKVEEVIKNNSAIPISVGNPIDVDRLGGRVKFPNGKVGLYFVSGQEMPQADRRYLFFLTNMDKESGLSIVTGYELRDGRVYLLDYPGEGHPMTKFAGEEEVLLLDEVRKTIDNSN
jgi:hypothetical protein